MTDERIDAVRAVNDAFYAAHEGRDLDAMRALWTHTDRVVCVHPGWPILRGWADVETSWRQIFDGPGENQFLITNTSITVATDTAWITLEENLIDAGEVMAIAATNIFSLDGKAWKMVAHHAAPIMPTLGR